MTSKHVSKIVILGGTGFVGGYLNRFFSQLSHTQVITLGREAFSDHFNLSQAINGCDLLIMLAGANIGQRWSAAYKKTLWDSRINTNHRLAIALNDCDVPPKRVFSASAIGIYPQNTCATPVDETCQSVGDNELGRLGQAWEEASQRLSVPPVIFRFGVVLGKNGGALAKMLPPFKLGLGGPVAGGQQCFSWVHIDDLARAMHFVWQHPELNGVFNLTSPNPVSNAEFGGSLAKSLHRPFWLPLPEFQLKLMFGEGAMVLTHSSAVIPTRLLNAGFTFTYPTIQDALNQIVQSA
jgi:hypothetical protein